MLGAGVGVGVRRDPPRITLRVAERRLKQAQARELRALGEAQKHGVRMAAQQKKLRAMERRARTLAEIIGKARSCVCDAIAIVERVEKHGPITPGER